MSVELIQQAVCYMEEHIYDDITYVETAKSVRMSGYDFHRTFRFVTGMTANEYIRNRRLALAAQELQATDLSVTEAAYKYVYRTPESFSKAFSKFHGSTPKQVKHKGAQIRLFNPLVIKITMEGGSMMDYRMEHRERQKFIALVREFPNEVAGDDNDHSIPDFWSECGRKNRVEPMQSLRPEGKRDVYGLCSPMKDTETHFRYGIGVMLDGDTDEEGAARLLEDGYTLWETEPADYAVFSCIGTDGDCLGETWEKFFKEFVPQTGYVQTDGSDYEIYFENGRNNLFCELWVPVKKK